MELSATRFVTIDGATATVAVDVTSDAEARAAIKELRHKKKELRFLKRSLARALKAQAKKKPRGRRSRRKTLSQTFIGTTLSSLGHVFSAFAAKAKGLPGPVLPDDPASIARDIEWADEVSHNIDDCLIQIEGRLINRG